MKGFELLRNNYRRLTFKSNFLPRDYLDFASIFRTGEGMFHQEVLRKEGIDFDLPLTSVYFRDQDFELGFEYLYRPDEIDRMLSAGELEEDTYGKSKLVRISYLTSPANANLFISVSPDCYGQIFAGEYLSDKKFCFLAVNIFEFAEKLVLIENRFQLNDESKSKLVKRWGVSHWTLRENNQA